MQTTNVRGSTIFGQKDDSQWCLPITEENSEIKPKTKSNATYVSDVYKPAFFR